MELPPFLHHHQHHHQHHQHRYVPSPSSFSENPNLYNRLPPPPPPQEQPPPRPLVQPPPPLPPPHHLSHPRPHLPPPPAPPLQSQFSFRPHRPIDPAPSPAGQFSNFFPPHLLNQPARPLPPLRLPSNHHHRDRNLTLYDENPRFPDPWPELPPPPRAPVEPDFLYQPHRGSLSPLPPRTDSYINHFDRGVRFNRNELITTEGFRDIANQELPLWGGRKERDFDVRDDFGNGDKYLRYHSGREEFERNISSGFERDIHRSNMNLVSDSRGIHISGSPSRDFALNVGNYVSYNDREDDREEDLRWGYSRLENNREYIAGDGVSLPSHAVRRELLDSGYDDVDKFSDRVEEGVEEFYSRSPRKKQVQKRSALLRIQLGKGNNRNNNRNRSHDGSRYSRSYYDDSKSSFGGSFKGKDKDDFAHLDWNTEGQREKSPVELDVSFKSNALVARAIKATSSPMVELDRNLAPRNRKLKKIHSTDAPGIKSTEDSVTAANSTSGFNGSPVSDRDHKELTKNIISFKAEGSTVGLDSVSSSDKPSKESAEMVIPVKTDSCASGLDFRSGCVKDPGLLMEEASVCDRRAIVADRNIAGEKSPKLVTSDKGVKCVAPGGVILQGLRKRKTVGISPQNETVNTDNSNTNGRSAASQLDECVTHSTDSIPSARMDVLNDVCSPSPANDLTIEEVNNASENVVSDIREDGVGISSSLPVPCKFSTLMSVSSNPGDTDIYECSDHADSLVHGKLAGLNSDKDLFESQNTSVPSWVGDLDDAAVHPCLNGSLLVDNDVLRNVTVSVESNAGLSGPRANNVPDSQIDASTSNHDACSDSTSDQRLCRRPGNIISADKINVNGGSKKFLPNQVNVCRENDIDEVSPDQSLSVTAVNILGSSKIDKPPIGKAAENQDLFNNSSSSPTHSTSDFSDYWGKGTVSDICLLEDRGSQSIDNDSTTLPVNAALGRSPKSMVSHSPKVGRKRKNRDDQLDMHDRKMSKIAASMASTLDDNNRSLSLWAKNLVSEEEVDLGNGENSSGKDCSEEGPLKFNPPVQGGNRGEDFSLTLLSPVLSENSQDPKNAIVHCSSAECLSNTGEHTTQPEDRVDLSGPCDTALAGVTAYSEASVILLQENIIARESYQLIGCTKGYPKLEHGMSSPAKWEADKNDDTSLITSAFGLQPANDSLSGSVVGNFVRSDLNEKQYFGDGDCQNHLIPKENLAAFSDSVSLCADVGGVSPSSSTDRQIDSVPNTLSCMGSPEDVISNMSAVIFNNNTRLSPLSDGLHVKDRISNRNPVSGDGLLSLSMKPSSHTLKTKSVDAVSLNVAMNTKAASLLPRTTYKVTQDSNPIVKKSSLTNNRLKSSVTGDFPGHTSIKPPSAGKTSPFIAKPRTWHRTLNSSSSVVGSKSHGSSIHPQINTKREVGKVQNSYVRRGNSLVRKPSPVDATPHVLQASGPSVHHLDSGVHNARKGRGSENRTDIVDPVDSATLGASDACPVRPRTPLLMGSVKLPNCITPNPEDSTFSPLADRPRNESPGEKNDPSKSAEAMDMRRSSQDELACYRVNRCQTGSSKDLDYLSNANDRNNGKKIVYVKRKSNQLVATSDSEDLSLQSAEKTQVLSSGGYYKRRKNQLIRTLQDESVKQRVVVSDKILSSHQLDVQKNIQTRTSSKKQSDKGFMKKKFSLVWTLHGTLSSRKDGSSGRLQRVLPYLFPWRRATYRTNFMHSLSPIPIDSPVSKIRQKLLLSRKRDAIYKRSISGFSLRRSKVLSVGGRSLKWSKSIERSSRKANEDATLAVVATDKRKIARNGVAFTLSKSRNYISRERIFRVGSERYSMDPTRKTLQRISEEQPSFSDDQSGKNRKKFYVPRRLLIGSDEYVRIGNGNQLVRNPKRRTRVLANEKVRWSLHTARLRLARKKKYCQFFTRFGKCNKDDKKCPYIHDPSKIAVCTKFLNGSCSDPDCKLTHQVIPERMQDCSYFLQGLCSNESCPYRHVNVNPNSPICEGFLRGYCADGNECRKKHTYVCPVFEATENCPQGPKCKLHHPKKKRKGMKRKASNVQKNARGRYFGAMPLDVTVSRASVSEITSGKCDDILDLDGKFADYISLDVSIEEMEQTFDLKSEPTCDSEETSHTQVAEIDELIKPVRLMKPNLIIASSPAVDSSSEMTTSYVSEESQCCR